jgi:hypothetical protein
MKQITPLRRLGIAALVAGHATALRADHPTALAELARGLGDALLQGVQEAATLHLLAARTLLDNGKAGVAAAIETSHDALQSSWRAYCICATSAAQILELTQGSTRSCEAQLGRALEEGLAARPQVDLARVRAVRDAFATLRTATIGYLDAALGAHHALAAIAQKEQ